MAIRFTAEHRNTYSNVREFRAKREETGDH